MAKQQVRYIDATGAELTFVGGALPTSITSSLLPASATWFSNYDASTANSSNTETVASATGKKHYLLGLVVDIEGAASSTVITIEVRDGSTVKMKRAIPSGAVVGSDMPITGSPIFVGTAATALNIVVGAGGAGCITGLSYWGYTL